MSWGISENASEKEKLKAEVNDYFHGLNAVGKIDYICYDRIKAESEETETWNGIHAQITAPKGTFERIFNDADDDNDI